MSKIIPLLLLVLFSFINCAQKPKEMQHEYTNALIKETSPYLLQHAHNPVNWEAWHPEVLERAKQENKLLLISIGYAACHWCHVMEHECFEDIEVAKVMNDNFINIKIDREERPDIDHIYMDAIQMMTGSGGWPLNIVALPDGRPFWGATFVPKENWIKSLEKLSNLYNTNPDKVLEYAQNLSEGIKSINLVENNSDGDIFNLDQLDATVKDWSGYFDTFMGGYKRAPKFMMPVNLDFLMHYGTAQGDAAVLEYVNTTLTKMAWGGIFDHVGGGFSRYSVDTKWHVPHFEKMLYDNGQLISLYSKAYAKTKNELYKDVVKETIAFVERELTDKSNGFYSSLDADSIDENGKLVEGAYYVWKEDELKSLLKEDYKIFKDYFNINSYGLWEHGNYVLIRDATKEEIAKKHSIEVENLNEIIDASLKLLDKERNKKSKPRLDDKILTSWNGLLLKGLIDAYRYLGEDKYLDLALKNANFIQSKMMRKDGGLYRNHKNGKSNLNGYLEDYAAVIDAYIGLYEITYDEKWLSRSKALTDYCLDNFLDNESGMFFFTSKGDDFVIRRTIETTDNVIPASNSIMAQNLYKLSKLYPDSDYENVAQQMLKNIQTNFAENAQSHANWLQLALFMNQPFYEIAIVGDEYKSKTKEILQYYIPNSIVAATENQSDIAILNDRYSIDNTLIYVCIHGSCKLPQIEVSESLKQMQYEE
ncbi:MAG: thioredoxin domain-containing protein [Maribacter sp.]